MDIPFQSLLIFNFWPDVSINRSDSEIQMFTKYFQIVKKNEILHQMTNSFDEEEPKSKNVANTFRTKGNSFYKIFEYTAALDMYNISISRAPRDSIEFALAVGNRSAVLFDMKKYNECLKDIDVVLRSEYPKNLIYKVFLRQSKCYLELNLVTEAVNSLKRSETSFEKEKKSLGQAQIVVIEDNFKNLNNEIKEQKEKPSSTEEVNNNIPSCLTLRDGENSMFLNASRAINFRYNSALQRCVVATNDIKKGDVLFMEKPYAMCALNQARNRFIICAFCLQKSLNCIPCASCATNFYCSSECQEAAWDLIHRWECISLRRQIITDTKQKLSLSILFKASRDGFKTDIEDNSIYGNKDNNYAFMNQLLTHKNKIPKFILQYNIKAAVWMVMYLKNFTDYFDWLYNRTNRPEGSKEDLYNIVGGHFVKYLLQIGCNMDAIQEGRVVRDLHDKSLAVHFIANGVGIYLSSALINHSCLPNAIQSYHDNVKIVKALEDVPQGTEITVSYLGGSEDKETKERQSELEKYLFKCSCILCTNPDYNDRHQPFSCLRCRGKAFATKGRLAKCAECKYAFNKKEAYKKNENKIAQSLMHFQITGHLGYRESLDNLLKKTYHKHHAIYIIFYTACLKNNENNGEYEKNIEIVKLLTETTGNIFGYTNRQYLITLIECTYSLIKYCNIRKKQKSESQQRLASEAKEYINKTVDCLQYYMGPKDINVFVHNITEYLNSTNINDDGDNVSFENFVRFFSFLG